MKNLLSEILKITKPEDIEGIVLGKYPYEMSINWETFEYIKEPYEVGKLYQFNEVKKYLDIEYDNLSTNIFKFIIWTTTKIISISIQERWSKIYSIPRNPENFKR